MHLIAVVIGAIIGICMGISIGHENEVNYPSGAPILYLCTEGKDSCKLLMTLDTFNHCEGARLANAAIKAPSEELFCVSEKAFK